MGIKCPSDFADTLVMHKNFKFLENESMPAPTDCLRHKRRQGEPQ